MQACSWINVISHSAKAELRPSRHSLKAIRIWVQQDIVKRKVGRQSGSTVVDTLVHDRQLLSRASPQIHSRILVEG
eukprot:1153303-Pelagomonas_calceolata.AAC.3